MSRGRTLVDLALKKMKEMEKNDNLEDSCDKNLNLSNEVTADSNYETVSLKQDTNSSIDVSTEFIFTEHLPNNFSFADNVEIEILDDIFTIPADQITQPDQSFNPQINEFHEVVKGIDQFATAENQIQVVFKKKNASKLLVPYSDSSSDSDTDLGPFKNNEAQNSEVNSSSDTGSDLPKQSKTRKRRSQVIRTDWFAEKNRKRRETGQSYLGRTKKDGKWIYEKPKEPREMKARCHCKNREVGVMKCFTVNEDVRRNIFKRFWHDLNWGEKKMFINDVVIHAPTKRPRDRKEKDKSRRSQSFLYYFKIGDDKIRVCKTMFLNTLCIGRWTVLNWKNKLKNNCKPSQLRVERHDQIKPFDERKQQLVAFVDALPAMESHYCRSSSSKKYLLPEWSSKQDLYQFYVKDWCESHDTTPLSITTFNEVLSLKNIALFHPKKDECAKCSAYKVGTVTEQEYELHVARKQEARDEKVKDKINEKCVLTVDLQSVLMAPKSNVSTLYYKTKLQVHNLCFYHLNNHEGFSFLWNETEGGVNAEEFASIWTYFLTEKLLPNVNDNDRKVILYSDGCVYQNRNSTMSNALLNVAVTQNITIEQKYLEVGHTQMEADSMHSSIERCLRNKTVNVPAEYTGICKTARKGKPFDVTYLEHNFFKSFDDVKVYHSIRPGKRKGDPKVTDIRALRYTPDGNVYYKMRFCDEWTLIPQRKSNFTAKQMSELNQLHVNRLPITARKYNDLQDIKAVLPADYRGYYEDLPHIQ